MLTLVGFIAAAAIALIAELRWAEGTFHAYSPAACRLPACTVSPTSGVSG